MAEDRFGFPRAELRTRTARGAVINGVFLVVVESALLVQYFVVARLLSTEEVGLYGIVSITVMTLLWLKRVGVDEAYVQQDDRDQEQAFQRAFTFELVLAAGFAALVALLSPAIAAAYGAWELAPLTLALAYLPLAFALQSPAWVFFRRMDFVRQRSLMAIVPIVTCVATIALVAAGLGVWGLVLGAVIGNVAAAAAAVRRCPYRIRLVLDRDTARRYVRFSWPIAFTAVAGMAVQQGQLFAFDQALGLAGAGYITLAIVITRYADRADQAVTSTIYPAICAVKERTATLTELFSKSNRLTAMWALPFGAVLALFAPDLVAHVLGERWSPATILLQVLGVTAAIHQLGFNWAAFYRARGRTRPQAVYALAGLVSFVAVPVPLLFAAGISGFAFGMLAVTAATFAARAFYIKRLLPDVRLAALVLRAMLPALAATVPVLAWRALDAGAARSVGESIAQLAVYLVAFALLTWIQERRLVAEVRDYLAGRVTGIPLAAERAAT